MSVKIRRVQFDSTHLPSNVQLVISDAETAKESTVWISARFPVDERETDKLGLILMVALDELQKFIGQAREKL